MKSAGLPLFSIGNPVDFADCLIGAPVTCLSITLLAPPATHLHVAMPPPATHRLNPGAKCRHLPREQAPSEEGSPIGGDGGSSASEEGRRHGMADGADEGGERDGEEGPLTDEELALRLQEEEHHAHMLELAGYGAPRPQALAPKP